MGNEYLGLSLFVILLSFFIVLNAFSTFEIGKAREVMNSISVTFADENALDVENVNFETINEQAHYKGQALDEIEAFFTATIPGVKARKNRLGTVMVVRVPLDEFRDNLMNSKQGQGFGGQFAPVLSTLLIGQIPYRMDMLLNHEKSPAALQADNSQRVQESIAQVAGFAQKIEEAGLSPKYVASGLGQGPEGTIDLYFRRYLPFVPLSESLSAQPAQAGGGA